jgi:ribosomal protein S6E (S10)
MFLQVIQGKIADPKRFSASLESWVKELGPSADGWLGTTSGTFGDGSFIALARFESGEAAKRNSDRPEQAQWWSEFASCLDGEASFDDFDDVILMGQGGSDDAGFVQVMRGRVADVARERELAQQFSQLPSDFRPDIIGGMEGLKEDGTFVLAMYFTSEAEAREGEKKPMPADVQAMMDEGQANTTEMTFIDLSEPVFHAPS